MRSTELSDGQISSLFLRKLFNVKYKKKKTSVRIADNNYRITGRETQTKIFNNNRKAEV